MVPAMQNVNVYLIPFLGLLKILDKEHHFIMPIINENTLIIKNDKCKKEQQKKNEKKHEIHPNLV